MIKGLLQVFFVSITIFSYGQTDPQTSVFLPAHSGEEQKVTINVSNHSPNDVGELKDKLLGFQGKIVLVHYDENLGTMTIIYNENMIVSELIGEFRKSGFKDVLNPVSKGINETE